MPFSRLEAVLPDLIAGIEKTYLYGSVLVEESEGLSVRVDRGQETVKRVGPERGAVLTGFDGLQVREVATVDLSPKGLRRAADLLSSLAPAGGKAAKPAAASSVTPSPPASPAAAGTDPARVPLSTKLDLCRSYRDRGLALDQRCRDATAVYDERRQFRLFGDRSRILSETVTRVRSGVGVYIADGGPPRVDFIDRGGTGGYEAALLPERDWAELTETLPALLGAERLEPGFYDVVACPAVAGLIAHEAFGHGVELDMFLKDRARSREYLGRPVGSPLVNLFDDPTYPGGFGSYGFDDEGQPAARVQIIREGVFLGGLTDLYSASRLGLPRTSNGRRESFRRKAYARMSNTFFGPGKDRPEDLIAGVDCGVYLGRAGSGMEDPKGWGIQCLVSWGREIRGGRLTGRYFSPIGLTGYVPDLLASVSLASSEVELDPGYCGKGYKEVVPVGSGGPFIKMKARLS